MGDVAETSLEESYETSTAPQAFTEPTSSLDMPITYRANLLYSRWRPDAINENI